MISTDVVIIGAGVIGLAVARALVMTGRSVIVLEREAQIGTHTSSRNSEVIHAGLYYPNDSLKARLCVAGRELLYCYCRERGIAHARLGKLVVATELGQLPALEALKSRGEVNGVRDLQLLDGHQVRALEPHIRARAALFSPSTGLIDSHGFMSALDRDARAGGTQVALRTAFVGATRAGRGFRVRYGGAAPDSIACSLLVNAAGLFAPAAARQIEPLANENVPEARYAKGHYFALRGPAPFSHLIYPLPDEHGLGIHVTLDLAGRARFGPDVSWTDSVDYRFERGRERDFEASIRKYYPSLDASHLVEGYTGIRPKLAGAAAGAQDFVVQDAEVHGLPGLVNLFGIESPGLTAALALADYVRDRLDA